MLAKREIVAALLPGERRTLLPHVLSLVYLRNQHGAMGLFGDRPAVLIALSLGVLVLLALLLHDALRSSPLAQSGFGLIAGGAAGNVVDRFMHGYVVDFISAGSFYVFNVADACVTIGVVLIALGSRAAPARR